MFYDTKAKRKVIFFCWGGDVFLFVAVHFFGDFIQLSTTATAHKAPTATQPDRRTHVASFADGTRKDVTTPPTFYTLNIHWSICTLEEYKKNIKKNVVLLLYFINIVLYLY